MSETGTSKNDTNSKASSERKDEGLALVFDSEREKALFEHKLKIRRIIWDRFLWAVVIVILGFTVNIVYEKYKADLTKERFFLEKRLDAVLGLQPALSDLLNCFERFTVSSKTVKLPQDHAQLFQDSLFRFQKTLNTSIFLFSEDTGRCTQYSLFIFSGLNEKGLSNCYRYREFVYDVAAWMIDAWRRELGFETTATADDYPFHGVSGSESHRIDRQVGTAKFLDDEHGKWEKWQIDKKATKRSK